VKLNSWVSSGVATKMKAPAKRKVEDSSLEANEDEISVAQKKVFMSRKERKVFESLLKKEEAKASKAEALKKKKMKLAQA
jgi:hypothetical protein